MGELKEGRGRGGREGGRERREGRRIEGGGGEGGWGKGGRERKDGREADGEREEGKIELCTICTYRIRIEAGGARKLAKNYLRDHELAYVLYRTIEQGRFSCFLHCSRTRAKSVAKQAGRCLHRKQRKTFLNKKKHFFLLTLRTRLHGNRKKCGQIEGQVVRSFLKVCYCKLIDC